MKLFSSCLNFQVILGRLFIFGVFYRKKRVYYLTDNTLKLFKQKSPKSAPTTVEVLLPDQPESIHRIKYENVNAGAATRGFL